MKTADQWIDENSQSGALDQLNGQTDAARELIQAIQMDALSNSVNQVNMIAELRRQLRVQNGQLDRAGEKILQYRNKLHEARRYLRAANKGAERNAMALQLAAQRIHNIADPLEGKVWQWLSLSDADLRLRMGELTAQEIRICRAMLRTILGTAKLAITSLKTQ